MATLTLHTVVVDTQPPVLAPSAVVLSSSQWPYGLLWLPGMIVASDALDGAVPVVITAASPCDPYMAAACTITAAATDRAGNSVRTRYTIQPQPLKLPSRTLQAILELAETKARVYKSLDLGQALSRGLGVGAGEACAVYLGMDQQEPFTLRYAVRDGAGQWISPAQYELDTELVSSELAKLNSSAIATMEESTSTLAAMHLVVYSLLALLSVALVGTIGLYYRRQRQRAEHAEYVQVQVGPTWKCCWPWVGLPQTGYAAVAQDDDDESQHPHENGLQLAGSIVAQVSTIESNVDG